MAGSIPLRYGDTEDYVEEGPDTKITKGTKITKFSFWICFFVSFVAFVIFVSVSRVCS